jgi:hypothetical protein
MPGGRSFPAHTRATTEGHLMPESSGPDPFQDGPEQPAATPDEQTQAKPDPKADPKPEVKPATKPDPFQD